MKTDKPKIGIIGCGFVGSAVAAGFSLKADMKIYDKYKQGFDTIEDVCGQDIIFLCLPTPMRKSDRMPEMSFIHTAIKELLWNMTGQQCEQKKVLVIKSTVLPGTNRKLQQMYPQFHFISNPEFLTARSARLDFINAARIVLGGNNHGALLKVYDLYSRVFTHTPIHICTWEEAEMVKYMANCFFALKLSYLNEIFVMCKKTDCDFNTVKKMFLSDGRIGNSHHEVPGHDGDFGFGGTCFPKDISAFTGWARQQGLPIDTLEAAIKVNERVRENINWEVFDDTKGVK